MSKATVRKALRAMDKEEIVGMVAELYDARRDARDYLDYWAAPDPEKAFDDYCTRALKMFFYSTGKNRSQPSASDLKRLVADFSSLVFDPDAVARLLLVIAEAQVNWLMQRTSGFLQAEKAVRRALDAARLHIEVSALEDQYGLRYNQLEEKVNAFYADPPQPRRRGWRRW